MTTRQLAFETAHPDATLRDVVSIFFRRLPAMLTIFVVSLAVAGVWILGVRGDVYETTAKILVRIGYEQEPSVTVMDRQTPIVGYRHQDVATEVQILNSTDVLARVVDRLHLGEPNEAPRPAGFFAGLAHDLRRVVARVRGWTDELLIRVGMRERLSPREQVIDSLARGLQVVSTQESNVVVASLRLPFRKGAASVLSAILEEYLSARVRLFQEQDALELLRRSMEQSLEQLRQVEAEIRSFESASNIVSIDVQKKLLLERQDQLGRQLKADDVELSALSDKLATLRALRASGDPDFGRLGVFAQGSFAADRMAELAQLRKEQIRIESAAGGQDQRTLDENRRRFNATLALLESSLGSMISDGKATQAGHREALNAVDREIAALQGKETAWRDLRRRSELVENEYKFYRHEVEAASTTSSMQRQQISNVKIIQHPTDPLQPAGTRKLYLLMLAAFLCACAALAWASLAEFLDHRVYTTSQVAAATRAPIAGVQARLRAPELERALARTGGPRAGSPPSVPFAGPAGFVARHAERDGSLKLLLTSARGGEGTTTTVLGIAQALVSAYGTNVLAVEVNPSRHGFQATLGLAQAPLAFSGDATPTSQDLTPLAPGLSLLSIHGKEEGGAGGAASAGLLTRALASLADGFDLVLIDAPPVLDRPEALAAAPAVAGVLLVVESGRTRVEMLAQIRSVFDREQVNLLGSVLTKQRHAIPSWVYRLLFP